MNFAYIKTGSKNYKDFPIILSQRPKNIKKQSSQKKYYELELQTFKRKSTYYKILKENIKRGYFPCICIQNLYKCYNNCSYYYFFIFLKKIYKKHPLFFIYKKSDSIVRVIPTHIFKAHVSIWVCKSIKIVGEINKENLQEIHQYGLHEENKSFC